MALRRDRFYLPERVVTPTSRRPTLVLKLCTVHRTALVATVAMTLMLAACTSGAKSDSPLTSAKSTTQVTSSSRAPTSTTMPVPAEVRAFGRLAKNAETLTYVASYKVVYPGGTLVTTKVAQLGHELMWATSSPTGLQEFIQTDSRSYLCQRPLHGGHWSCSVPVAISTSALLNESEPRVLYGLLPSLAWQPEQTAHVTLEHKNGRRLICLYVGLEHDPAYTSDWCVTSSGLFASAVLEEAAAGPKYQYVTLTAYSQTVTQSLFVPPAKPTL